MLPKCNACNIRFGDEYIPQNSCIKLLGMQLDENLNLKQHIANKSRVASYNMFNFKKLRPFLSKDHCLQRLFVGLPRNALKPFQRIQNFTAKAIFGRKKYDSSTDALKDLHILPIHVRSKFKLLVMVFKCLNNLTPSYLSKLHVKRPNNYRTRASESYMLEVPFTKHKTFADRSFSIAGPQLWNDLPVYIKQSCDLETFKKNLKTHLFSNTFT